MTRTRLHTLPGRIRLRHPALRDQARAEDARARLSAVPHVSQVSASPRTGSLLVRHAAGKDAKLLAALDKLLAELDAAPGCAAVGGKGAKRPVWPRYAKFGMMASLSTSLVLAALGRERAHIVTGLVFAACLSGHLTHHRKRLTL